MLFREVDDGRCYHYEVDDDEELNRKIVILIILLEGDDGGGGDGDNTDTLYVKETLVASI